MIFATFPKGGLVKNGQTLLPFCKGTSLENERLAKKITKNL